MKLLSDFDAELDFINSIRVLKINSRVKIPEKAHFSDAGYDLYSNEYKVIHPGERASISTGVKIALPINCFALVCPRSGLAVNYGITILNSPGIIDNGYRGEIKVPLINLGSRPFKVNIGNKIAQLIVLPINYCRITEVDKLDRTQRGEKGFGSTGR